MIPTQMRIPRETRIPTCVRIPTWSRKVKPRFPILVDLS